MRIALKEWSVVVEALIAKRYAYRSDRPLYLLVSRVYRLAEASLLPEFGAA